MRRTLAVVGGGLAGLAAALAGAEAGARVVVLEGTDRLGGKVRVSDVGGLPVDEGADAMLARLPDGVGLARLAGLGDELVSPATAQASIWTRGRLRPLPAGTLLGVPGDLAALARSEVLSARGLARVPLDLVLPGDPPHDDLSVGELVRRRLGAEVVDRLVDPLLGGVYAGRADHLSLQATLPQLARAASTSRSLIRAVGAARALAPASSGPVFLGIPGGLGRLAPAVAAASGAQIRTGTTVRGLTRTAAGWRLELGSASAPAFLDADAVVLAVPAPPAARLLRALLPFAAHELAAIDYSAVAIVTLVLGGPDPGVGSGYLVPAVEGLATKAVTFTSRKWGHYPAGQAVVRASLGRAGDSRDGDSRDLQRGDRELVALVRAELELAVGPVAPTVDSRVVRWGGALPQYAVGHLDRVRRIRAAVATQPGLAVAGAAYDGVGVPAVARSGREAARQALRQTGPHDRHDASDDGQQG